MRDDVERDANGPEKMAEIERNMNIARRYLNRTTFAHDPIFDLPVAEERIVPHPFVLQEEAQPRCNATGRKENFWNNRAAEVVVWSKVTCALSPGHDGPHVATVRTEVPRLLWRALMWESKD